MLGLYNTNAGGLFGLGKGSLAQKLMKRRQAKTNKASTMAANNQIESRLRLNKLFTKSILFSLLSFLVKCMWCVYIKQIIKNQSLFK